MQMLPLAHGTVDLARGRFEPHEGDPVKLTRREVELLAYLASRAGEDVSRDDLLAEVWGHHELSLSRAVDAAVTRLRRKIEPDVSAPMSLCTAHGYGYRLVLDVPAAPVPAAPMPAAPTRRRLLVLHDVEVDLEAGLVRHPSGEVTLTGAERLMLQTLARDPGVIIEHHRLARAAGIIGGRGALSNAVHRLRSKLETRADGPDWIIGVRGQGYRLDVDAAPQRPALIGLSETLWTVADHVGRVLGLEDCVIYARDRSHLVQVAAYGVKAVDRGEILDPIAIPVGQGIVGTVAAEARPQLVTDVRNDPRYIADAYPGRSELAVPIVHDGEVVGVLDSEHARPAAYGEDERAAFESLARIAAAATADLRTALDRGTLRAA